MNDAVFLLSLEMIDEDALAWPRSEHDAERVLEFMELYRADGPNALPPIFVTKPRFDGKCLLVDGHHRVEAAYRLREQTDTGWESLPAMRNDAVTAFDAFRQACRLSGATAKPLTRKEKRAAVGRYLRERCGLSDKEIAKEIGVSHTFVWEIRTGKINVDSKGNELTNRINVDEQRSEPASENKLKSEKAAEHLIEGLQSVYSHGRYLPVNHIGKVVAEAAIRRYGTDALKRLADMRQWTNEAVRYAQERIEGQA